MLDKVEPAFRKLTRADVFHVGNLITTHCKRRDDGSAEYEPGWSDERIRVESGTNVSVASIGALRLELVGSLKKKAKAEPLNMLDMQLQLSALRQDVDALMIWAASRPVEPFKL